MSLAVLIPYRPDTERRVRIQETTKRLWSRLDVELVYSDDGLRWLFSYAKAANRARLGTKADVLVVYNTDALPLSGFALERLHDDLMAGMPWSVIFDGQQSFTEEQTERLMDGVDPVEVGPPASAVAMGREALLAIRADVWDSLRGMDERFVGWGPEDVAWHHVLKMLYPTGNDVPANGLFQSLAHPHTPRSAWTANDQLWKTYLAQGNADRLRSWYLGRP